MLLTIITPVYNTAEYLRFSIESCLEQNVSMEDYEIIFIDDGSVDQSPAILDEYAAKYPNLTVVHKVNEGVSVARNVALDLARGEYIWFIDSDDFIEKHVLPDIFEILRTQKPQQLQLNMYHMKSDYFTPEEEELFKAKKLVPGRRLICSAIYRAECINKAPTRFHPELTSNGDLVFSYELKKSIGGYTDIATYDPIVYYYRKNGGSITYRPSSKKLRFMREKKVYPVIVPREGSDYYRAHYKSMGIKGIPRFLFRWIPTPVGYAYVMIRSLVSKILHNMRNMMKRK